MTDQSTDQEARLMQRFGRHVTDAHAWRPALWLIMLHNPACYAISGCICGASLWRQEFAKFMMSHKLADQVITRQSALRPKR